MSAWLRRTGLICAVTVLLASEAFPQEGNVPLESYAPQDAAMCVYLQGFARASGDFKTTALMDIIRGNEVQEFGKELARFVDLLLGQFLPDPAIARWSDVRMLLDCEAVFVVLDTGGREPEVGLVIRPHGDPAALKALVERILTTVTGPGQEPATIKGQGIELTVVGQGRIGWMGNDLLLCAGMQSVIRMTSARQGKIPSLVANPVYQKLHKKVSSGKSEFMRCYVDMDGWMKAVQRGGEMSPEMKKLGLDAISKLYVNVTADAPGIKVKSYLHMPTGVTGLWEALPREPLNEKKLLGRVAADASSVMVTRTGLDDLVKTINLLISLREDTTLETIVKEQVGFDVLGELSGSLSNEMTVEVVGPGFFVIPEFVLSIEVKDRAACRATLDKLLLTLAKPPAAAGAGGFDGGFQFGPPRAGVMVDKILYKGHTIEALKITAAPVMLTPSFALSGDRLIVGALPQSVKKALDRENTGAKTIRDNPFFMASRKHVSPATAFLSYVDPRRGFSGMYGGILTPLAQMSHGAPMVPPHNLATRLPNSDLIVPHLLATIWTISFDGEGFLFEGYGTLGGMLNSSDQFQVGSMGQMGILAGFMLPAMAKGQESARRAACLNNMRQIGLAMLQYAGENDDKYPDSFGVLLKEGYLNTHRVFFCPQGRNVAQRIAQFPAGNYAQMPLAELKKIDDLSDYVMVKGVDHTDAADIIVVHEKDGAHRGDGRNCLHNDCHVRWYPEHVFQRVIQEQQKRLKAKEAN